MIAQVVVLLAVVLLVAGIVGFFVRLSGASLPIRNGVHTEGIIRAWRYTGMYAEGTGNFGSVYELELQVTPAGGGEPCLVRVRSTIDTLAEPEIGARVAVIISPTNPRRVKVDHKRTHTIADRDWHTPSEGDRPGS